MNLFKNIPPTAGFSISIKDIISGLEDDYFGNVFESDFKNYLQVPYVRITSSGTAALFLIANSLKELTKKRTFILPSYICPLIPLAIKRAGFNIELCDIRNSDFSFDPETFRAVCASNDDIAAVLINHLAGIPFDFGSIEKIIKEYGLFVVEDCAQSLGAEYQKKKVGTIGDFSFFSLGAGKGLSIYAGGVLVTKKKDYEPLIDATARRLVKKSFTIESRRIAEFIGYCFFYRPMLFGFVFTLPQMFWTLIGNDVKAFREDFSIDFPVHAVSQFRKSVGHACFAYLPGEIEKQREKALYYFNNLKEKKNITFIREAFSDYATYPYVTIIIDDPIKRKHVINSISAIRRGVSLIYARALPDYDSLKDIVPNTNSTNARYISDRIITLSTSTYMKKSYMDEAITLIKNNL
jgi:perosamine synthetase